ncbi:hypothetical protein BV22DRAFT_1037175 [Leucogyrophana mollusca]|uniref:Uncharacterized protein n=1 Tax=Leucogyrophana mollusca TaxID=85980 RepID=A0ACB8BB93_9AGAM|nr:hypothetical protein BV22DRAFT_1037175 [Leucogyrophana mollusca]
MALTMSKRTRIFHRRSGMCRYFHLHIKKGRPSDILRITQKHWLRAGPLSHTLILAVSERQAKKRALCPTCFHSQGSWTAGYPLQVAPADSLTGSGLSFEYRILFSPYIFTSIAYFQPPSYQRWDFSS